jgi:uncharacterized protein
MDKVKIIRLAEDFAARKMEAYDSGHDVWHIERVRKLARKINSAEKIADPFILDLACILHDTADSKFAGAHENKYEELEQFLKDAGLDNLKHEIIEVINNISFSNKNKVGNLKNPVLLVLQDADRLDAIGAIGVARAFNYGGFRNNLIYDPVKKDEPATINHFYEKLLKLKSLMNTETGLKMAEERHLFLEEFLAQFYKEWDEA